MNEVMKMARITNEILLEKIGNIKEDTTAIKEENKEQWKIINKQGQSIASQKSVIKIIEGFMTAIVVAVVGLFIGKYK